MSLFPIELSKWLTPGLLARKGGGFSPNFIATTLDPTGATDSSPALQAMIDAAITKAAAGKYKSVNIYIPQGKYKLMTQLVKRSYISLISIGHVILDFSSSVSIDSTMGCIRDYNDLNSVSDGTNGASSSRRVGFNGDNGCFEVIAPAAAKACFDVGNDTHSSSNNFNYREVTPTRNVHMRGASYGVIVREKDTYMVSFDKTKFGGLVAPVLMGSTSVNENSGEKIVFNDCVFVAYTVDGKAFSYTCGDWGIFLKACSIDFMFGAVSVIPAGLSGIRLHISQCHLEKTNDNGLFIGNTDGSQNAVTITNSYIFPMNRNSTEGSLGAQKTGTRTDGKSVPRIPLFQGKLDLTFTGNTIQGYDYPFSGGSKAQGVFMCDDNVTVVDWSGNKFRGYGQSISLKNVINRNAFFESSSGGTQITTTLTPGWMVSNYQILSGTISTSQHFDGNTKSLKLGPAANTSDFITLKSDLVPWPNRPVAGECLLYASPSLGTIAITYIFEFWARQHKPVKTITSITRSGAVATANIVGHGLEVGEYINVQGCSVADYNGRKLIHTVVDADNVTFAVYNNPATPAAGTPTYTIEYGGMTMLGSTTVTQNLSDVFASTDDPANTGSHDRMVRLPVRKRATPADVPAGTQYIRSQLFITNLAVSDVVYLLGAPLLLD